MAAGCLWRRLWQGSALPANYASRITQKQCFLPTSDLMGVRFSGSHVQTQERKTNPLDFRHMLNFSDTYKQAKFLQAVLDPKLDPMDCPRTVNRDNRVSFLRVNKNEQLTLCEVTISEEPETLYKRLSLLVKGHDKAVLDSYEYFAVLAAKELGISVEKIHRPPKKIERFSLLKSVHIYKKHRVQYEMRTHYTCLELKYLTGSTAAVYLEYVERNLPEGVAMEVKKTKIERIPEHIQEPVWDTLPQVEETEIKS